MIEKLLALQKLELEIDRIREEAQIYPSRLSKQRSEEEQRRKALDAAKAQLEDVERQHRDTETNLKLEEERLRKSKVKSKELKTEYEYSAMLRQIEGSKRSATEMEEAILKFMEQIEGAKKSIADLTTTWETARAALSTLEAEVAAKMAEYEGVLSAKDGELKSAEAGIDKAILNRYRFIRERKHKDALAVVSGGSCQGCYMNIPHQTINEMLHQKTLFSCPNCNRMIYLDPPVKA